MVEVGRKGGKHLYNEQGNKKSSWCLTRVAKSPFKLHIGRLELAALRMFQSATFSSSDWNTDALTRTRGHPSPVTHFSKLLPLR